MKNQTLEEQLTAAEAKLKAYMKMEMVKDTIDDLSGGLFDLSDSSDRAEAIQDLVDRTAALGAMDLSDLFEDLQDQGHDSHSAICSIIDGSGLVPYENVEALRELVFLVPTQGWDT